MSADKNRERLVIPVAAVIIAGQLAALYAAVINQEYAPLTIMTPALLLLAGFAFGTSIVRSATRASEGDDKRE